MNLIVFNLSNGDINMIVNVPDSQVDINDSMYKQQGYGVLRSIERPAHVNKVIDGVAAYVKPSFNYQTAMAKIRYERDLILKACDWTQMSDVPLSLEQRQAWAAYRQLLRDFPKTCDIENPVWPVPPVL